MSADRAWRAAPADVPPQAAAPAPPAAASAAARPARLEPLRVADIDAVVEVERRIYEFPWSRGNFVDSVAAGYLARRLIDERGGLIGYFVAMRGVDEMHLLNLGVDSAHQRRGHARAMLEALVAECRAAGLGCLWLEVRAGNERGRRLYARHGFVEVGVRRGYYPAAPDPHAPPGVAAQREDAVVMTLDLGRAP